MVWIYQHQTKLRLILLVLILVAFMGPWEFDRIHVPAKYPCSAPFIRLEGDYCGKPLSGIWLFPWIVIGFISSSVGLIMGGLAFTNWIRNIFYSLLFLVPFLPIFSTLILIFRSNHSSRQIFTIIIWGLAIALVLFHGINNYPKLFWLVWGIWFYCGVGIGALILEMLAHFEIRKLNQKSAPAHHS